MKHLFLICTGLCISVLAYTQSVNVNTLPDKLKVTLAKDSMFIVYKNQEVPAASVQVLDSLLKKVPVGEHLTVEFESTNGSKEKIQSINAVLKQCHCHIARKAVSFNYH